jgi:hypothetical protein
MIPIDKSVPLPRPRPHNSVYPWQQMDVGDSFFAPCEKRGAVQSALSYAGKRNGFKFATRTVTENGVTGVRVWRVS